MPDRKFIITLAKLLIAAAWVDGELKNEEINALKDLLFSLEDIAGEDIGNLLISCLGQSRLRYGAYGSHFLLEITEWVL